MANKHKTGRPRCTACVRFRSSCFRQFPTCSACAKNNRECVYEVDNAANPGGAAPELEGPDAPNPRRDCSITSHPTTQSRSPSPGPAGVRKPRATPTEWGTYGGSLTPLPSRPASPGPPATPRRTRSLSSLLNGDPGRALQKRANESPELDPVEWHTRRARKAQALYQNELEALKKAKELKETARTTSTERDVNSAALAEELLGTGENRAETNSNRPRSHTNRVSEASDNSMVSGYEADGAELPPPQAIINVFKRRWDQYFSFALLTDSYCKRAMSSRILKTSTSNTNTQTELVDDKTAEEDLTYEEWTQAWRRALSLMAKYLSERHTRHWSQHYTYIDKKPGRAEHWRAWLAYDMAMRHLTRQNRAVDPG